MLYDSRLEVLKGIVHTKERLHDQEVELSAIEQAIEVIERGDE